MGLKNDLVRLRRIDDLDREAYIAAQERHDARLVIHEYEKFDMPFYEILDDIQKSLGTPESELSETRQHMEIDVARARDQLGNDSPERWRSDQQRIERYLLQTGENNDAQRSRAWGADPDTMWEHHQKIGLERDRRDDAKVHAIITKRFAVENEKGSPIRFDNLPRYGTPIYPDGSIGDPKLYPREWTWPLPDHLDNWLCVIDEVEEVQHSDEERLQEIENFLGEKLGIDFMSLCPAPGEQCAQFERINNFP